MLDNDGWEGLMKRPNGGKWLATGGFAWVLAALSLLGLFAGAEPVLISVFAGLFLLALTCTAVGSVIRALWYLPAREIPPEEMED